MSLDSNFLGISTLLYSNWPNASSSASGFFFHRMESSDPEKEASGEPHWKRITGTWIVTNRHVLELEGELAHSFTFHFRKIENNRLVWSPIVLTRDQLFEKVRFHANKDVDVAVIDIDEITTEYIKEKANQNDSGGLIAHMPVSAGNYPGNNKIDVEVSDDALVIGYPRGFYDQVNLFPIVKSGIIASNWKGLFNGNPYFLIDAKLFPGSSGSIVVSKPVGTVIESGQIYEAKTKQFAFLGVFSGEPYRQANAIELENMTIISKEGYNVGIVWYYWLVDETIDTGVNPKMS